MKKLFALLWVMLLLLFCLACQATPVTPEPERTVLSTTEKTPLTTPLQQDEMVYGSIKLLSTTLDELVALLGEPLSVEQYAYAIEDDPNERHYTTYFYEDANYGFVQAEHYPTGDAPVYLIEVLTKTDKTSPRNLKVGDQAEDIIPNFPDASIDTNVIHYKLRELGPFIEIALTEGIVTSYMMAIELD